MDYTGKGNFDPWYAANLLIWTKRTRVEMSPGGLDDIALWSIEKKMEELRYIAATIPSSWEMVDFTFLLKDVTRAFTHQLVRTRVGSYAQQNQSVQKLGDWTYRTGPSISNKELYENTMEMIDDAYQTLLKDGSKVEDARGILPTNVHTSIVVKWNLRTCCETFRKRASVERGHGEYQDVIDLMREAMTKAMPWTELFLLRDDDKVATELRAMIAKVEDPSLRMDMAKRVDQLMNAR
jgi:thymidylate synthase (FAD)